jgi:hypothetical protein
MNSARALVNYFALHKLSESLPDVLLGRHAVSDFHGFASCMLDSDISAFRWVLDRYVLILRSHNGDIVFP